MTIINLERENAFLFFFCFTFVHHLFVIMFMTYILIEVYQKLTVNKFIEVDDRHKQNNYLLKEVKFF